MLNQVGFGEYLLLKNAPFFKRRYAVDGDLVLGCTIGCSFCYYRMIDATAPFIGTGMLKRLATPEEFAEVVANSKLISERSLVIMGARGDASMYPDEVPKVLETAERLGVGARFLALRRAPYDRAVAEHLAAFDNIYYGTTITPKAREVGTPVSEERQLDGLRFAADFPHRVSIEVGPINIRNIDALRGVLKALRDLGWDTAIYRGVSAGSWGLDRSAVLGKLLKAGFLTEEQLRRSEHSYFYAVKNDLDAALETAVIEVFKDAGIKPYRHTGQFYAERWGLPVAKTRHNKVRADVLEYTKAVEYPGRDLRGELERLGYADAEVEHREEHGVRVARVRTSIPITEDVAMYLGEVTGLAVVADNYLPSPDGRTFVHYLRHDFFWMPERVKKAVAEALRQ
ncbi:MAG: radical SAM protein [Pyrobaculum sp.]